MKLTDQAKKDILNWVLRKIADIEDKQYQKRVWIRGEGPECDDFTETVCQFFDLGDPVLKKYKEYHLSENQYKILKNFRDEFETFSDDNRWPSDFIDTPEWTRITEMAKEVLKAFNYQRIK